MLLCLPGIVIQNEPIWSIEMSPAMRSISIVDIENIEGSIIDTNQIAGFDAGRRQTAVDPSGVPYLTQVFRETFLEQSLESLAINLIKNSVSFIVGYLGQQTSNKKKLYLIDVFHLEACKKLNKNEPGITFYMDTDAGGGYITLTELSLFAVEGTEKQKVKQEVSVPQELPKGISLEEAVTVIRKIHQDVFIGSNNPAAKHVREKTNPVAAAVTGGIYRTLMVLPSFKAFVDNDLVFDKQSSAKIHDPKLKTPLLPASESELREQLISISKMKTFECVNMDGTIRFSLLFTTIDNKTRTSGSVDLYYETTKVPVVVRYIPHPDIKKTPQNTKGLVQIAPGLVVEIGKELSPNVFSITNTFINPQASGTKLVEACLSSDMWRTIFLSLECATKNFGNLRKFGLHYPEVQTTGTKQ